MKTHNWNDVKSEVLSPEERAALETKTATDIIEMSLAQIREASGLTQVQLAEKLATVQSGIARIEKGGNDPMLSTLRRYVGALGGELKITAQINGKTVELVV